MSKRRICSSSSEEEDDIVVLLGEDEVQVHRGEKKVIILDGEREEEEEEVVILDGEEGEEVEGHRYIGRMFHVRQDDDPVWCVLADRRQTEESSEHGNTMRAEYMRIYEGEEEEEDSDPWKLTQSPEKHEYTGGFTLEIRREVEDQVKAAGKLGIDLEGRKGCLFWRADVGPAGVACVRIPHTKRGFNYNFLCQEGLCLSENGCHVGDPFCIIHKAIKGYVVVEFEDTEVQKKGIHVVCYSFKEDTVQEKQRMLERGLQNSKLVKPGWERRVSEFPSYAAASEFRAALMFTNLLEMFLQSEDDLVPLHLDNDKLFLPITKPAMSILLHLMDERGIRLQIVGKLSKQESKDVPCPFGEEVVDAEGFPPRLYDGGKKAVVYVASNPHFFYGGKSARTRSKSNTRNLDVDTTDGPSAYKLTPDALPIHEKAISTCDPDVVEEEESHLIVCLFLAAGLKMSNKFIKPRNYSGFPGHPRLMNKELNTKGFNSQSWEKIERGLKKYFEVEVELKKEKK